MNFSSSSAFFRFGQLVLSWRFLRVAALAYGLSSLLLWATLGTLFVQGAGKAPGQSIGPDFAAFYTAGTMFRQGEKAHLYDFKRQQQLQQQLQLTQNKDEFSAFVHPAQWAVIMAPFSALSPRAAYAIYALLMFTCFVAGSLLLRSLLPVLQTRSGSLLIMLALFSPPVYFSLSAGQNTGLTFLLHCAILVALLKKRDFLAGVLCGVGLLKPHLFLVLLPLFWFGKRPRALVGFSVIAVATVVFNVSIFGTDVFIRNWDSLQTPIYGREEILQGARMFSWQSFWKLLLGNNLATSILGWSCALIVFAALCLWWRQYEQKPRGALQKEHDELTWLYAMTICGLVVVAPHLPVYDLGLLLLPMLVFANRVLDSSTDQFFVLRILMLSVIAFTTLGEEFANQTHFQIVVPLVTLLLFVAARCFTAPFQKPNTTLLHANHSS